MRRRKSLSPTNALGNSVDQTRFKPSICPPENGTFQQTYPSLVIGTFNTRGTSTIVPFIQQKLLTIDILAIQEHWLVNNTQQLLDLSQHHSVVIKPADKTADAFYRVKSRGKGGVALFIRNKIMESYKEIPTHSSRILASQIHLKHSQKPMIFVCCYLPCGSSPNDQSEYLTCLAILAQIRSTVPDSSFIIAGDFNADIVKSTPTKKTQQLLRDFMEQQALVSLTREFHQDNDFTFRSDDGRHKSNIDGFLVPTADLHLFPSLALTGEDPINTSDHLMVLETYSQQFRTTLNASVLRRVSLSSG